MNFQKLAPVESGDELLEIAFRKAREKGKSKNLVGNWLQIIRKKETLKLDIVQQIIHSRLTKTITSFPDVLALSKFYIQLMKLTLDFPYLLKSLAALNWGNKKIHSIHRDYVRKIYQTKERQDIKNLTKQFYGRVSSIIKQIDVHLSFLEKSRQIMRTYPDVKEMFTVCVYGFPNVGKSTFLNKLTTSKAKVASYAFTTKEINAGYFTTNGKKIQVFDVPGTLARENKMNPIELQAELVLNELADLIVYVFDISEQGGYSIKKQEELLKKIKNKKKVLIYFSKTDLVDKIPELKHKNYSLKELKEKIVKESS
mgnify:CR=1 FL=1